MADLTTKGLIHLVPEASQQSIVFAVARIDDEAEDQTFEDVLNEALRNQQKNDEKRLFVCSVVQAMPHGDEMQESHESAATCHEQLPEVDDEA